MLHWYQVSISSRFRDIRVQKPVHTHRKTDRHTHTRPKWFYILSHAMYCIGQTIILGINNKSNGMYCKFNSASYPLRHQRDGKWVVAYGLWEDLVWLTGAVVYLSWPGATRPSPGGHRQIKLLRHIFAFCSVPPISSRTFSLAMLAQFHFIPQLEMQVYNVTLPTPVIFSCISGVIIPNSQLPKCTKTRIKLQKYSI